MRDDLIDRAEEVGDDRRSPERHLAPYKYVTEEGGGNHQDVDDHAEDPQHFAWGLVGAVVEATKDVDIDGEEEHRCAGGVQIPDEPAVIHLAHDVLDGVEGEVGVRHIVHRKHYSAHDLHAEAEGEDAAEGVPDVQIPWRRKCR